MSKSRYTVLKFKEFLIQEGLAEDLAGLAGVNDSSSGTSEADNIKADTNKGFDVSSKEVGTDKKIVPVKVKSIIFNDPKSIQDQYQALPYSKLVNAKNINEDPKKFLDALSSMSKTTGIPMENMLTVFAMESGMVTKVVNSLGYTGLFQLSKKAIERYGLSVDDYRNLPGSKQIEYFKKYLEETSFFKHDVKSLANLYLAVFYPVALSKGNNYVLGEGVKGHTPQLIAKWNPAFVNNDGVITKQNVADYINNKKNKGFQKEYCYGADKSTTKQVA